ncbi:MAG: DUF2085 domain-containing protein [Candidatus Aminicenantes bacterium]|nr:DUF2085 domain-containing protein [Candidatus Aminicenantes bacterium]
MEASDSLFFVNKTRSIYFLTLSGIIVWIAAVFAAAYLKSQSSAYGNLIYAIFSPTCHQIPSRCLTLYGNPLAVCTRCLGIYIGFFLGTCLFPVLRGLSSESLPKAKILILMSLPIVIDTAANVVSPWASPHWLRLATGLIWGAILPFYFIPGVTDIFKKVELSDKKTIE